MGFVQDPKTGAWYKEGTTPAWLNGDGAAPAASPSPPAEQDTPEEAPPPAPVLEAAEPAPAPPAPAPPAPAEEAAPPAPAEEAAPPAPVEEEAAPPAPAEEAEQPPPAEEVAGDYYYDLSKNIDIDGDGVISSDELKKTLGVIEGDKSEEPPEDKLYTHLFELCVKIEDGAEPEGEMIESSTTNFSHKTVHDALQYLSEAEMDIFNSLTTTVKA